MKKNTSTFARLPQLQDWAYLRQLWPVLVGSVVSEKATLNQLKRSVTNLIATEMSWFAVTEEEIPDSCVEQARQLWTGSQQPCPSLPAATDAEIQQGLAALDARSARNRDNYEALALALLREAEATKLWRPRFHVMKLLTCVMQSRARLPDAALLFLVQNCVSENHMERRQCSRAAAIVLHLLKRKHPKIRRPAPTQERDLPAGARPDNQWLQYQRDSRPLTARAWDDGPWIDSEVVGYHGWARDGFKVPAPWSARDQSPPSQLELDIEAFFTYPANLDRLVHYWSLEERKPGERPDDHFFLLFRGLFRNYGDKLLDPVMKHAERLCRADQTEGAQRCAAALSAGAILGAKYWSYEMSAAMWARVLPVMRAGMSSKDRGVRSDWLEALQLAMRYRDPMRLHWLMEFLVEQAEQARRGQTSTVEAARYHYLFVALFHHSWRSASLQHRALRLLEERVEESPLKTVRDVLPNILNTVHHVNKPTDERICDIFPDPEAYLARVYPRFLRLLEPEVDDNGGAGSDSGNVVENDEASEVAEASGSIHGGASEKDTSDDVKLLAEIASKVKANGSMTIDSAVNKEAATLVAKLMTKLLVDGEGEKKVASDNGEVDGTVEKSMPADKTAQSGDSDDDEEAST